MRKGQPFQNKWCFQPDTHMEKDKSDPYEIAYTKINSKRLKELKL